MFRDVELDEIRVWYLDFASFLNGLDFQATSMTPDPYLLEYICVKSWRSIYLILSYGFEVVVIFFRYQLRKFNFC